jgi:hypothetical protein
MQLRNANIFVDNCFALAFGFIPKLFRLFRNFSLHHTFSSAFANDKCPVTENQAQVVDLLNDAQTYTA